MDKYEVIEWIEHGEGGSLTGVNAEFTGDKDVVEAAVRRRGVSELSYASKNLLSDPEFMSEMVKINGYALRYASPNLKNDPKIVKEALEGEPLNVLEEAGDTIRNNPEFMINYGLEFAGQDLKDNPEFVMKVMERYCDLPMYRIPSDGVSDPDKYAAARAAETCMKELTNVGEKIKSDPQAVVDGIVKKCMPEIVQLLDRDEIQGLNANVKSNIIEELKASMLRAKEIVKESDIYNIAKEGIAYAGQAYAKLQNIREQQKTQVHEDQDTSR